MKKCAIIGCRNTIKTAPEKRFFYAPREKGIRGLWIYTTGKNYQEKSNFVVCQDHFNVRFRKSVQDLNFKQLNDLLFFRCRKISTTLGRMVGLL